MIPLVEHLPILTILVPLFSAFATLVVGWFRKGSCIFFVWAALSIQFVLSLFILHRVLTDGPIRYWVGGWMPPWGIELVVDTLNAYILLILLFLCLLCAVYSKRNIEHELPHKRGSYYTLFLLLVAGLCGATLTGDIFNMFVFIEIFSLSAYALIASRGKIALKASFTYLILGSIGTCFFVLGIGCLYSITGTLNIHDLSLLLPPFYGNKVIKTAFVFFLIGLSIKMALFPFHTWLPDAHAFAPAEVSAILSGIMIEVSTYAFLRLAFSVFTIQFLKVLPVFDILCAVAVAAILFGSTMAISQVNLKRMLAYSSVANMGYIVLGVGLSLSTKESPWGGLNPALIHIANHALMKGCLFLAAGAFIYKGELWEIPQLEGLARKMPYTCAAFLVAAISMIGIPPTVGFVSKLYLILASIETGNYLFVAALLVSSLLNLVYFWRIIESMYMRQGEAGHDGHSSHGSGGEAPIGMLIPILLLASLCIGMGIVWLAKAPIPMLTQINHLFGLGKGL
ncbi:MAG: monovalent cation/H+ antiporter subunit D family protein [Desulfobacterota bacterium]|nr:monovalent cation/H+ antiporter subunit D family protein [Thermodesulfobacteriota bacterium]